MVMPDLVIGVFLVGKLIFGAEAFIIAEPAVPFLAAHFDLCIVNRIDFCFLGLRLDEFP